MVTSTSVLKNRYESATVDMAASMIEAFRSAGLLPRNDDLRPWAVALDWLCENCGGVDKEKGNDMKDRPTTIKITALRDYLAALAITGRAFVNMLPYEAEEMVKSGYLLADAMIKARSETDESP